MSRVARHPTTSKKLLWACVLGCAALSLAPSGWTGFLIKPLGSLVQIFVTPVSHPMSMVAGWLSDAEQAEPDDAVEAERARLETLVLSQQQQIRELRERIRELQGGREISEGPMVPLIAPVVGRTGDLTNMALRVRAGRNLGVTPNTVVAVRGTHLYGRVTDVTGNSCLVRPMTSKSSGPLGAMIFEQGSRQGLLCTLSPVGDGTLEGPVDAQYSGDNQQQRQVSVGSTVRLSDDSWAMNSQMLVVGTVTDVRPDKQQPLRQVVTVQPSVDLQRVGSVILRLTPNAEITGGGS